MSHLNAEHKLPLTSPLITGMLMVICIMLAMVGANIQVYQSEQATKAKQLIAKIKATSISNDNNKISVYPLSETFIFSIDQLPDDLQQRVLGSEQPVLLPKTTLKTLGWTQFGGQALVMAIPNTRPVQLMVIGIPRKNTKIFLLTGLYLSLVILAIILLYATVSHARQLRRLRYINSTAIDIVNGNLDKRIPINPKIHDEYSQLAHTLNEMLEKNAQLMQDLRQVNNNIAHDLKSPLNRMRSRMEVALLNSRSTEEYEQALERSIADVNDLLKTFQALLLMGNLDSNSRNYHFETVNLSELITNLADLYAAVAEEKSHTFSNQIASDIEIFGNANLLAQALSNLLENAIKYTPEGGSIDLHLQRHSGMACIVISDNGPGIPPAQHQAVFERFSRLDSARQLPGTGLGLSLVRAILKVHKASIQLHDNQPGLRVEIRLRCL